MSPVYDYQCQKCDTVTERIVSIDDRDVPCYCGNTVQSSDGPTLCMGTMKRIFTLGHGGIKCWGPTHPLARYGSEKAYQEHLAKKGKVWIPDATYDEVAKHDDNLRKEQDAKLDKFVEKKVEQMFETLGESGIYTSERRTAEPSGVKEMPKPVAETIKKVETNGHP